MNNFNLNELWESLRTDFRSESTKSTRRRYQALPSDVCKGVRASCFGDKCSLELLVLLSPCQRGILKKLPEWRGMSFSNLILPTPKANSLHLRLYLEDDGDEEIFKYICKDLVSSLSICSTETARLKAISSFLHRWTIFFKNGGLPLQLKKQSGLFGELYLIQKLIKKNVDSTIIINSWKGCERGEHDFQQLTSALEVKTTLGKAPYKVTISNERQLDDTGLSNLYLFSLILRKHDEAGCSLPTLINQIRTDLSTTPLLKRDFDEKLFKTGYIDIHSKKYTVGFSVLDEESYRIAKDFPRITSLPLGVGNITYSLTLDACKQFSQPFTKMMTDVFMEKSHGN